MRAVIEAMVEKELPGHTLADQPPLHIAHRGDHGVDVARLNLLRQLSNGDPAALRHQYLLASIWSDCSSDSGERGGSCQRLPMLGWPHCRLTDLNKRTGEQI